jgi:hypothetical protein
MTAASLEAAVFVLLFAFALDNVKRGLYTEEIGEGIFFAIVNKFEHLTENIALDLKSFDFGQLNGIHAGADIISHINVVHREYIALYAQSYKSVLAVRQACRRSAESRAALVAVSLVDQSLLEF